MDALSFSGINGAAFILLKKPIKYLWNLAKSAQSVAPTHYTEKTGIYSKHKAPGNHVSVLFHACPHPNTGVPSNGSSSILLHPVVSGIVRGPSLNSAYQRLTYKGHPSELQKLKLLSGLYSIIYWCIQQISVEKLFRKTLKYKRDAQFLHSWSF